MSIRINKKMLMTEDLLAEHFFNPRSQAQNWNLDPNKLTIGLELEYIIRSKRQNSPLIGERDYLKLYSLLRGVGFNTEHQSPSNPYRLSKNLDNGFVSIQPDFAFHILEIALPPLNDILKIKQITTTILETVDSCLDAIDCERTTEGNINNPKEQIELLNLPQFSGHVELLKKVNLGDQYSFPTFPAFIAATHVHLNVLSPDIFSKYRLLFEIDSQLNLDHKTKFNGLDVKDLRRRMYESTLGVDYLLSGTKPGKLVSNFYDYVALYNESTPLFPNHPFFPVKDLSFIRPTSFGTMEFRSSYSLSDSEEIINLVAKRIWQVCKAFGVSTSGSKWHDLIEEKIKK